MRALLAGYYGEGNVDLNDLGSRAVLSRHGSLDELLGTDPHLLGPSELDGLKPEAARQLVRDGADREGPSFHKVHSANYPAPTGERVFPAGAGRALYVVRNPLDVAASWAPFFAVSLDQAVQTLGDRAFVLNRSRGRFDDVLPELLGSWSDHVTSWLDAPGLPVHVVRYEDLKADPAAAFAAALRFVGEAPDPTRVAVAVEAARFERLQARESEEGFHERPARGSFFRKGRVGGWRDELSPEQARRVESDHRTVMERLGYGGLAAETARR